MGAVYTSVNWMDIAVHTRGLIHSTSLRGYIDPMASVDGRKKTKAFFAVRQESFPSEVTMQSPRLA